MAELTNNTKLLVEHIEALNLWVEGQVDPMEAKTDLPFYGDIWRNTIFGVRYFLTEWISLHPLAFEFGDASNFQIIGCLLMKNKLVFLFVGEEILENEYLGYMGLTR